MKNANGINPIVALILTALVCVLTVIGAENDLTGFEKRVPDPDKVDHVEFCFDTEFSDPKNIRLVTELRARDFDRWTRLSRVAQTLLRPPYAWNKPGMLGLKLVVRIPERFWNIV